MGRVVAAYAYRCGSRIAEIHLTPLTRALSA